MKDEDIVKALKCCGEKFGNCKECPYSGGKCVTLEGESILLKDAVDLIDRQRIEINILSSLL